MKIILFLSLFLFAGMAQAFEIIGIDSVNVTAAYTEPVTNEDDTPLTDLNYVIVFYDVGLGPQVGIQEPASMLIGGTFMTVVFPVPIGAGQEADVTFFAKAWDANPSRQQVTKYQCEYQINAGPFVVCDADIIGTSYVQIVLGVISGDEIGFRLRACNVIGCSTFTQTKVGVVPPDVAPDEPINFKILLVVE